MTPGRSSRRLGGDAGSGTVLVLGLVLVLASFTAVLTGVGVLVVTRHRADAAADLAALAAAVSAVEGSADACAAAARTAAAAGVTVVACSLQGDEAVVAVELLPPGQLAALGPARSTARAGP